MDLPREDDVRRWALAEIGASSPEQAKIDGLRLVARAEFAPSLTQSLAIGVVLNRSRRPVDTFVDEAAYSNHEDQYCQAVEDFARDYFQFSPLDRRRRWESLMEGAVLYPWWRPRLVGLQAGLDVMLSGAPASREFAGELASLYILPPGVQAAHRRTLYGRLRKTKNLNELLRQLKHGEPSLHKLMRDELDSVWGPPSPRSASRLWTLLLVLGALAIAAIGLSSLRTSALPSPRPVVAAPKDLGPVNDAVKQLQHGNLDGHWGEAAKRLLEGLPVDAMGKKWVLHGGHLEPDGWVKPADWAHPDLEKNARWFRKK